MIKPIFVLIALFFSLGSIAQQDYLITIKGDTLTGQVKRGNLRNNYVTLKNMDGTQKIHLREIREWKNGVMPVIVIPHTQGKRTIWYELLLEIDGHKKLFRDLEYVMGHYIYYTFHNGKYIQLTNQVIDGQLVPELSKCDAFVVKYGQKTIRQSNLEEVFGFYNSHCEN